MIFASSMYGVNAGNELGGAMTTEIAEARIALRCVTCGDRQAAELSPELAKDLISRKKTELPCDSCEQVTDWRAHLNDRREVRRGVPRRTAPRVQVEVPIRVRYEVPKLQEEVVGRTLDTSCSGALLASQKLLQVGMQVMASLLYPGLKDPSEIPAEVVRQAPREGGYEIGIRYKL
jgi:hypothetical protein